MDKMRAPAGDLPNPLIACPVHERELRIARMEKVIVSADVADVLCTRYNPEGIEALCNRQT